MQGARRRSRQRRAIAAWTNRLSDREAAEWSKKARLGADRRPRLVPLDVGFFVYLACFNMWGRVSARAAPLLSCSFQTGAGGREASRGTHEDRPSLRPWVRRTTW